MSNCDPLDLIERDLVAGAIIELGGARAFVRATASINGCSMPT
jgi:hypothetical protein